MQLQTNHIVVCTCNVMNLPIDLHVVNNELLKMFPYTPSIKPGCDGLAILAHGTWQINEADGQTM